MAARCEAQILIYTARHTVSQRGVVFFRNQDINIDDQKLLGQRLGELTGKPELSKLHRHALSNSKRGIAVDENGRLDDEVSIISSEQNRKFYKDRFGISSKRLASDGWHAEYVFFLLFSPFLTLNYNESDADLMISVHSITFERIPADYSILKIVELPGDAGGDTLWASGYEAYDRLSPEFKKLAERLTATHHQPNFVKVKDQFGEELISDYRGHPENNGLDFKAEQ